MHTSTSSYAWAALRITIGWILLWAFFDKLFGLSFTTESESAWINDGSPTKGFLEFGTSGPFADMFSSLAGIAVVDWLFMLGLGLIGASLILGIGIRVATTTGILLFLMMWMANLPPEHNPLISEHIVYVFALWGILSANEDQKIGLGQWWSRQDIVKRYPIIR